MNLKIFKFTFLFIILTEFLSFFGYFYPIVNKAGFLAIVLTVLVLSLYRLEFGALIILAELFIGSKGYLLSLDFNGSVISIRIALWLIVMAVWAGKTINDWIKNKKIEIEFFKSFYFYYFFVLFILIAWGIINGFLNNNGFNNLFFDLNGWLYFLLVFPIFNIIEIRGDVFLQRISYVFTAAIIWLCLKTFFLLFVFSHFSPEIIHEIYRWVRTTGVGEITQVQGGFYRIFFQSHIFVLVGFFIFLIIFIENININFKKLLLLFPSLFFSFVQNFPFVIPTRRGEESLKREDIAVRTTRPLEAISTTPLASGVVEIKRNNFLLFCFLVFLFSCVLISFSRSFWLGLVFGLIFVFAWSIWKKIDAKKIVQIVIFLIGAAFVSLGFVVLMVKFPYPRPLGGFDASQILSERASETKNEAAIASRWELLPKLWSEIKEAPVAGKGFGATIAYKSSDPRVLEQNPKGEYTTYAFEWGWLDVWLKLGIGGLIAYLFLMGKIIYNGLLSDKSEIIGLSMGLIVIMAVNVFTPYLNHPLGIGYLILASALIEANKKRALKTKSPLG